MYTACGVIIMRKIAVLSAKGGVGKTTLSVSLANYFASKKRHVTLVDGDVNAPNIAKWFNINDWDITEDIKIVPLPNKYKKCNDLKILCDGKEVPIIAEKRGSVKVKHSFQIPKSQQVIDIISGDISEGKTGSGKVVEEVLARKTRFDDENDSIKIIDTAPGTGYPVLTAMMHADFVVLVTEASSLGLVDLNKLLEIARLKKKSFGIIVNFSDKNPEIVNEIRRLAEDNFLGAIKSSNTIAESLKNNTIPLDNEELVKICEAIEKRI